MRFRIGQVVKVIANVSRHEYEIGQHYRITACWGDFCDLGGFTVRNALELRNGDFNDYLKLVQ